jgi:hypothetical protein
MPQRDADLIIARCQRNTGKMTKGLQLAQAQISLRQPDTHRICSEKGHGQTGSLNPTI